MRFRGVKNRADKTAAKNAVFVCQKYGAETFGKISHIDIVGCPISVSVFSAIFDFDECQ